MNKLTNRLALAALIVLIKLPASAQSDCAAEIEMATAFCTGLTERCVTISVNSDPSGRIFIHEWDMGDGTLLKGKTVDHCYATYGQYQVVMNLIDSLTGYKIKNELIKDLLIAPMPTIDPATYGVGLETKLSYTYNPLPGFTVEKVFWDFGDGNYGCGLSTTHAYDSAAKFVQRVLLKGQMAGRSFSVCNSNEIMVQGPNVKSRQITDWFVEIEKQLLGNGRFLKDGTHLALLNKAGDLITSISINTEDVYLNLLPQTTYSVYAWRGNLFSKLETFITGSQTEANQNLHEALLRLMDGSPMSFPAYQFDLDKTQPTNEASLGAQLNVLKEHAYLNVAIGSYTHSGGYFEHNLMISSQRSEWLKQFFVSSSISAERLRVISVTDDKRLLNSCIGTSKCDWEDERLNRKTEFRITSPK